jgi:hypothetical protein
VGSLSLETDEVRSGIASPRIEKRATCEKREEEEETTMSSGENSDKKGDSETKEMSEVEIIETIQA